MPYNNHDPYHVHAYLLLEFECDTCGKTLIPKTTAIMPEDRWCEEVAEQARREGFWVPPPSPSGMFDVSTCYCAKHRPC